MSGVIGQELEIEFRESDNNSRKGLKATTKVGGRFAFPDRQGQQPQDGDIWNVKVIGENPSGSVYFLRCVSRVSTRAERKAAQEAADNRLQKLSDERRAMTTEVSKALQEFTGWNDPNPTISVGKHVLPVEVKFDNVDFTVEGVTHNYSAQAKWEGQVVPGTQAKHIVVVPWSEVEVSDDSRGKIWMTDREQEVACSVKTTHMRGAYPTICYPLRINSDWGSFVEWRLVLNQVRAIVRVSLPMGVSQDLDILVGKFENGKISWVERYQADWTRGYLINRVPEPGPEQIAHLEAAKAAYEQAGNENQQAGLLVVPSNVFYALRELGVAGTGWAGYAGNPKDPEKSAESCGVIHPALAPLFDGAQDWDGPAKPFAPLVMRKGAPSDAWEKIEWSNGRMPNLEQVAAIRTDTVEEAKLIDQEQLDDWLREQQTLQAEIMVVETPNQQYKYRFDAIVRSPHKVIVRLNKNLGYSRILLSETQELRPHTVEGIAHGNEYFAGEATVQVEQVKSGRKSWKWTVTWKAPETKSEETERKVEAIRDVIRYGREYHTVLTGWRFTDTGNPVVYVGSTTNNWQPYEFDRETYAISRRKGSCSTKGDFLSDREPNAQQIVHSLKSYKEHGWPVEADKDWQEKAGKSILSLFPAELIVRIEGGA